MTIDDKGNEGATYPLHSKPNFLTHASIAYSQATKFRASIQLIPGIGGALDTILAGLGSKWQQDRLVAFVEILDERLRKLEASGTKIPSLEPSEPLYDLVMQVFDQIVRTRSARKREAFAAIVERQIIDTQPWEDAEAAARLASQLSDLDVAVLSAAVHAPLCESPFDGLAVVTIYTRNLGGGITLLQDVVPGFPDHAFQLSLATLVAHGLLHDEGIGRLSVGAMGYFVATNLGKWFIRWLGAAKT